MAGFFASWLPSWLRSSQTFRRGTLRGAGSPGVRLAVEALENRTVPSASMLDPTLGTGGTVTTDFSLSDDLALGTHSVAVQADGKIVVAGYSYQGAATGFDFAVARLDLNGNLDLTFSGDGKQTIHFGSDSDAGYAVTMQSNKIVVAGAYGGDFAVARLNDNGSLDDSFDLDGKQTIAFGSGAAKGVAVQADGKIVVAGSSYQGTATGFDFAVARLNDNGSVDNTFDLDGKLTIDFGSDSDNASGVAVQGGKIVVAGYSNQGATGNDFAVAQMIDDGSLDPSFDNDGKQTIDFGSDSDPGFGVALQADGKIVVAGYSDQGVTGFDFAVARLNDTGSLDNSFGSGGKQTIDFDLGSDSGFGVALQADGKILVAGVSYREATGYDFALTRLLDVAPAGLDADFDVNIHQDALNLNKQGTIKVTFSLADTEANDDLDTEAILADLASLGANSFRLGSGDTWSYATNVKQHSGTFALSFQSNTAWADELDVTATNANTSYSTLHLQVLLEGVWVELGDDEVRLFLGGKK